MSNPKSKGISAIELLVVLAVIAILLSLILPAIGAAREAARRSACGANLKQIGVALQAYATTFDMFPAGGLPHASLLPGLEASALFNSINFTFGSTYYSSNSTCASSVLSVFLCPSDSQGLGPVSRVNLAASRGFDQRDWKDSGPFGVHETVYLSSITDGQFATAAFSEFVAGPRPATSRQRDRLGSVFNLMGLGGGPRNLESFLERCKSISFSQAPIAPFEKGWDWVRVDYGATYYNHNLGPNQSTCLSGGLVQEGAWTASSRHGSGVNVLFCDGHVKWVREGVSTGVWRSLGTRAGGEASSGEEF